MKKTILALLLAAMSARAMAEWVKMGENDESAIYTNPTTIRKDGNFRKVWELMDLKQRDKEGKMSRRVLVEYDCKEERHRILSLSTHSEHMAKGEVLISGDRTSEWRHIPPSTGAATMLEFVCAK